MGLFDWLRRLLGFESSNNQPENAPPAAAPGPSGSQVARRPAKHRKVRLVRLRYRPPAPAGDQSSISHPAYKFSRPSMRGGWLDLSRDQNSSRLERFSLPVISVPEELAKWLEIPLGQLAWLVHRFEADQITLDERGAHYCYRWIKKRSGGRRLIEAPKPKLKRVQWRILDRILAHVPVHPAAHGFVVGRSIATNAQPHVGQRILLKLDLENFYASVSLNRVVAIFRSLGYSREAAIWLGRLTTASLPATMLGKGRSDADFKPYLRRHLPQGAPTSPALANLSAFSLDLRLSGLARTFGANYTRYADDLTFSGDQQFLRSLAVFIPLAHQIVRSERFSLNKKKRKIIRNSQRQTVTGVVVNARPNVARSDFDRLKAILTNCIRRGPSTQNHERHASFFSHLQGRIAHVGLLNPARGERLRRLFEQIDWNK